MKKLSVFSLFCKWLSSGMKGNPLEFIKKEKSTFDNDDNEEK